MRSSLLYLRKCSIANSQTLAKPLLQAGSIVPLIGNLDRRDGIGSGADIPRSRFPQFSVLGVLRFPGECEAADSGPGLTMVEQRPSIVIERVTSSYSFRSSELSQPI